VTVLAVAYLGSLFALLAAAWSVPDHKVSGPLALLPVLLAVALAVVVLV
jgi:hypothetical protein